MKDTPLIYLVRSWVDPERGQPYLDWLKDKHMAEVVAEPGILWARRVMLDQADDRGWRSCLLLYGFDGRAALDAYVESPARERFWHELEGFRDIHYSDRFWGDVDVAIDDPG